MNLEKKRKGNIKMSFEVIVLFIAMVVLNVVAGEMYRGKKHIAWYIIRYVALVFIPIICLFCNIYQ